MEPGPASRRSSVSTLTSISIASITIFAILIVTLHFLRPDLDPIKRLTSEYAVGQYRYLMTAAFFCMSIATFALLIVLSKEMRGKARSVIGLALLMIWGVAVLIAMSFPIDPEGAPATTTGKIHETNGPIGFLSLTLGVLLVSFRFKH